MVCAASQDGRGHAGGGWDSTDAEQGTGEQVRVFRIWGEEKRIAERKRKGEEKKKEQGEKNTLGKHLAGGRYRYSSC